MIETLRNNTELNKIRHAIAESSRLEEISIVIGTKDQYVVEQP
jgi:hypothetical protein